MEIQLKQRLVGLTVIFSLAVIFLPMLLDGSGRSPQHLKISIPPAPQIESSVRVEEKIIELKKETASLRELKPLIVDEISDQPDDTKTAPKTEDKKKTPQVDANQKVKVPVVQTDEKPEESEKVAAIKQVTLPEQKVVKKTVSKKEKAKPQVGGDLWVIQTGSFRDKNKAYKERDRVRKSKLSAVFIEKFEQNRALNYRVRMGPFLTRKKADVVRNKILAKYNIKGIVMKYEK